MKLIDLKHGYQALVDDEDYDRLMKYKWWANKRGKVYYAVGYPKGQWLSSTLLMHRIILNASKGMLIDHKDRNGLNNQKSNLRICTKSQNIQNSRPWRSSTTGYKGVWYWKERNKFVAYLDFENKRISLGTHKTAIEAARARDIAALKYYGEFAYLNITEKVVK
jgi:hypothetical protein